MPQIRLLLISLVLLLPLSCGRQLGVSFYVAPEGDDRWSGHIPEPNTARSDGPFATLERARQAVRELKREGRFPQGGVTIFLRGGYYPRTRSLRLDSTDSGLPDAPVVWRSYPGEKAVLSGGRRLSGFQPLRDPWALRVVRPELRGRICQIGLRSLGITEFGEIQKRGAPGLELFYKGKRMPLARYPNEGWLRIADVPQYPHRKPCREPVFGGLRVVDGLPAGKHYGEIAYSEDRPSTWSPENEVIMHGYWTWDWSDSYERVERIVPDRKVVVIRPPYHHYGYTKRQRYAFLNVLEELDRPGEWVLRRETGLLYFWPPDELEADSVEVSVLDQPLVVLEGCRNVRFVGLEFRASRSHGLVLKGCENVLVAGCAFTCLGDYAVVIRGSVRSGVRSCDLHELALGGILLDAGDRRTLTPGECSVDNNHIWEFAQIVRTYQPAVDLRGVGNRVAHNLIHDGPHTAVRLAGNEHVVEFNEIHHVVQETGDAGAFYSGRDYTWRGNVIRYNYFHHIRGPGLHGATAVYLDDFNSGFTVYGNVFYKASRGVQIGGGRRNTVENNIFVECEPSVHLDARGLGWAKKYFDGTVTTLIDRMKAVRYDQPPYSERYPELLTLYDDDPAVPKYNRIVRNISYGGRWMDVYDYWKFDLSVVTIRDNVIADSIVMRRPAPRGPDKYYLNIDSRSGYQHIPITDPGIRKELSGNAFVEGNPGILNFRTFRLSKDCPAWKLGFRPIPFDSIGLVRDEYRELL